ncbi:MAG TPA: hypothetical protein VIG25_02230 [Pyrinomonadaceae bacterium]
MKRCPQCSFLYHDSDEVCDLDGTPLVHASDTELDASPTSPDGLSTAPATVATEQLNLSSGGNRPVLVAAVAGLLGLLVLLSLGYVALSRRNTRLPAQQEKPVAAVTVTPESFPSTTPAPAGTRTPEISPTPKERPSPSPSPRVTRALVSNNPVSTGNSQSDAQRQVVIRLTDGTYIEADEAWRTKEGVWYRRAGMVTHLQSNRVKSIEKSARK